MKTGYGKKRSRDEASGSAQGSTPPTSPPRPNPNKEWKKSKAKTEDLLALVNSGFLREKEMDMWRATTGDPYPMEKNPDEIPMFARFVERGLALPASDFFKGLLKYYGIEYLNLNPNGIFHVSVFVHFCEAFVGIKPHWVLFRKFFRLKPQPSASDPRVVRGAGVQMREDTAEQYLSYKLIDSNQDWKSKWFYITNHHPDLPKPSGKQPKHQPWWNTEPTMQEGIQLPELLQKIKALREAGLRAKHVTFSFMKRRVQPLMRVTPSGTSIRATTTRRGCPVMRSMMTTSSRGWLGSSKICHHTFPAQSPSTLRLIRQTRLVAELMSLSTHCIVVVELTQTV
jgi:hypothetical protein